MDPINPWLDPSEVRLLAEQLLRPIPPSRYPTADAGFDPSFIGFTEAPSPPIPPITVHPAPIPPPAPTPTEPSNIENPPPPNPTPPPNPNSQTRFLQRIHIFRDWLADNFNAKDIFILDHNGKVIFDESGHGRLHFMARNLTQASQVPGNVHVKIGPSAVLEVIPCETPYGRIVLGTLLPESLSSAHVQIISEVLLQTASPA